MPPLTTLESIPVGSIMALPAGEERSQYLDRLGNFPPATSQMVTSPETGAYIRGLTNNFNLAPDYAPAIAFTVLRVALGEITLDQLATNLASELHVDTQKAQAMAQDIAKELFTPMAKAQPPTTSGDIPNLLDLKNLPKGP